MADPTTISAGTRVNGRIEGSRDVAIEGVVDGEIELSEALTVAEPGLVRADIQVREALISGAVEGDIRATERIVLTATARVTGTIDAPAIRIEDGARFSGEVVMDLGADSPSSQRTSSASTSTVTSSSTRSSSRPSSPSRSSSSDASTATRSSASTTTTTVVEEQEQQEDEDEEQPEAESASSDEPDFADMATDEIRDYTVKELREELRDRDLPVSGTKDELIERLRDSDED